MSTSEDPALPDSAMASGSDAGEPGEHLGPSDLEPDEQRMLAALQDGGPAPASGDFPEESLAAVRAAEDDGPLPAEGGPADDGLDPTFRSPDQG